MTERMEAIWVRQDSSCFLLGRARGGCSCCCLLLLLLLVLLLHQFGKFRNSHVLRIFQIDGMIVQVQIPKNTRFRHGRQSMQQELTVGHGQGIHQHFDIGPMMTTTVVGLVVVVRPILDRVVHQLKDGGSIGRSYHMRLQPDAIHNVTRPGLLDAIDDQTGISGNKDKGRRRHGLQIDLDIGQKLHQFQSFPMIGLVGMSHMHGQTSHGRPRRGACSCISSGWGRKMEGSGYCGCRCGGWTTPCEQGVLWCRMMERIDTTTTSNQKGRLEGPCCCLPQVG